MTYVPSTLRCPTPAALLGLRSDALALRALPARPLYELLFEIGRAHDCLENIADRLATYRRLTPEILAVTAGDNFPPHLSAVPR